MTVIPALRMLRVIAYAQEFQKEHGQHNKSASGKKEKKSDTEM
jgi:hypothetical protein